MLEFSLSKREEIASCKESIVVQEEIIKLNITQKVVKSNFNLDFIKIF